MEDPAEGDQQPVRLVDFPTELLERIFSYLPGFDKISLSLTCKRFNEVLLGPNALRQLNFSGESRLKKEDLKKFLRPLGRCSHVQQFFMDDCYWFTSSFVSNVVSRMKNITHLRLHGTQLKLRHLLDLMTSLKKVTHLSWSWDELHSEIFLECPSYLEQTLSTLISLRLHLPELYSYCRLALFLSCCCNLKELILAFMPFQSQHIGPIFSEKMSFPHLTSIVIKAYRAFDTAAEMVISDVIRAADPNAKWNCFWLDTPMIFMRGMGFTVNNTSLLCGLTCKGNAGTFWPKEVSDAQMLTLPVSRFVKTDKPSLNCSQLMLYQCEDHSCQSYVPLDPVHLDCTSLEVFHYQSSSLQWGLTGLYASNTQLTELNLIGYCVCKGDDRSEMCGALSLMTQMRKLALPACYLKGEDPPAAHSEGAAFSTGYPKRRKCVSQSFVDCDANGAASASTSADTGFFPLVSNCPLVEELELVDWQCKRTTTEVRSSEMMRISGWTKLKRLTLYDVPVSDGSFLPMIAESCKDLISLRIGQLDKEKSYTPHYLLPALELCSNLQEFWLQDVLFGGSMSDLCGALQHCTRLKQLYLDYGARLRRKDIESLNGLLIKASDLTCFFCPYKSLVHSSIKPLVKELQTKFKADRPALQVHILELREFIKRTSPNLAETHYKMMMCVSRVAHGPGGQML